MIEETQIVQDTRKIRSNISEQFNHNFNQYIDFLQTKTNIVFTHSAKQGAQPDARDKAARAG